MVTRVDEHPHQRKLHFAQLDHIAEAAVRLGALGPRLAKLADDMAADARDQAVRAQDAADNMEQLTRSLDAATRQLRRSSTDVEAALATVSRIAQHTRILAINANIEATRAGEHGRPFAVVVEEVQRLADGTSRTTAEIEQRMQDMRVSITRVAAMAGDRGPEGAAVRTTSNDPTVSTVGRANLQIHGIAESAGRQLAGADILSTLGTDVKDVTEALLLAVGTFRFAAHRRAERELGELLAELPMSGLERRRLELVMERWIERHGHFELVYLTDAAGRQVVDNIACTDRRARHEAGFNRDWSDRPWYRNAMASDGVVSTDIYRSTATGDFCFTMAAALRDEHGGIQGVLGADVNFQRLLEG